MTFFTRCLFALLLFLCLSQLSCQNQSKDKESDPEDEKESVEKDDNHPIKIVIIDDDQGKFIELKNKISREFSNLELGKVTFAVQTIDEFFATPEQGDLLFYSPHIFGELIRKNLIKTIPDYVVESEPYQKSDVFKNQRRIFGVHNKSQYAVPLGVSGYSLLVNKEALAKYNLEVPTTWADYRASCLQLATLRKNGKLEEIGDGKVWSPTIEPSKGNWLATTFMARAGSYIRTRGKYSVMFDYSTWKPLISSPPFVSTMTDLITVHELMAAKHQGLSPRDVELAFLRGECFMAITWPHPPSVDEPDMQKNVAAAAAYPLPGSNTKYDASQKTWVDAKASEKQVCFLGAGGFCGSVLTSSEQSGVATRRLGLLAGKEFSSLIGSVNSNTGVPYRASHISKIESWVSGSYPTEFCNSLAKVIEQQNQSQLWMVRSRVDRAREYESVLSKEIRNAMKKDQSVKDSLERVSNAWSEINKSIDANFQKQISLEGIGVK